MTFWGWGLRLGGRRGGASPSEPGGSVTADNAILKADTTTVTADKA